MAYEPSFTPRYPEWHDIPAENTAVDAATFTGYDNAIENIEDFLDGSTAIKPVAKTGAMTQQVGVDSNGALFTAPTGGSGGGAAEDISYDNTLSELTADDVQDAIDELASRGGTAANTTYDNTTSQLTADDVQEAIDEVVASVGGKVNKTGDTITGNLEVNAAFTVGQRLPNSTVGTKSISQGLDGTASGDSSIATGFHGTATATRAHSEGLYCNATAIDAYARGHWCNASAQCASAIGYYNDAGQENQTVIGKYNDNKQTTLFEIGNGVREYDEILQQYVIRRSNALEVDTSGNVTASGTITDGNGHSIPSPVAKTSGMTQSVGIDSNGQLWTSPGGGGGGGTAASVTYDNTTSGLTADDVQEAIDELAAGGGGSASSVTYNNSTSHLVATNVQSAIDEVVSSKLNKSGTDALTIGSFDDDSGTYFPGYASVNNGSNIRAVGDYAHAEGDSTQALANKSHAEGHGCITHDDNDLGECAHAEGYYTHTYGDYSHAEGYETTANGTASHTGGQGTVADYDYQTVCGTYNDNQSDSLFEVGNGILDYDPSSQEYVPVPSNAFVVKSDGDVEVGGEIDAPVVTTLANTDYVYVSVYDSTDSKNYIKKITIANLKTVLGIQ